jgi:hypothetical protein
MDEITEIAQRVSSSGTLPELLDAGFAAFEAIRLAARACEDRMPELFAAFMMAAGTAVEACNALSGAPSLPRSPAGPAPAPTRSTTADVACVADQLARLAALVAQRLHAAVGEAALPEDRIACQHGAQAADEVWRLLASNLDETSTR